MRKITSIVLVLVLCLSTLSVSAAEYKPEDTTRYIKLGKAEDYTLLYDTKTARTSENYTRVIGNFYFTTYSDELGLSLSDGEQIVPLERAYGDLIGDSGLKSVVKAINEKKENSVTPFDKWTVTKGSPNPREKFSTGSNKVYYLFGWIFGQNYACEENADQMGILRFEHGQLTVTLNEDAYVGVKEENNAEWYMTDGWLGTNVSSATLYSTSVTGENSNKLYVPAGVDICFRLVENGDGSLTLSYSMKDGTDPFEPSSDSGGPGFTPPPDSSCDPTVNPPSDSHPSAIPSTAQTDTMESTLAPTVPTPITEPTTQEPTNEPPPPTQPPEPSTDPTESPTVKPNENKPQKSPSIKLNIIAATLQAGKVITLKATDKNGKKVSVTFSSSNKKVAKVTGKGKVYALKRGVAKINVKYKKKKAATCLINVVNSPKLSAKKIRLKKGQIKSVKIYRKSTNVKNTYKSTKIARVISARTAKKLKIRALRRGKTTLKIKVNGVKLSLKVVVR